MDEFEKKPNFQVNQASETSGTTIAVIVAALVLVVGAFIYFGNNWSTPADGPQVTQNNTSLPAPAIEPAPAPAPAEPPAAEPATPPVTPPAAPSADAPATNP